LLVIPAKAGIHLDFLPLAGELAEGEIKIQSKVKMAPSFRWDDVANFYD
jgi:hypothetical protein